MTHSLQRTRGLLLQRAQQLGIDQPIDAWLAKAHLLRSGPRARRNYLEDKLVRLVAASCLGPDACCIDIGANEGHILAVCAEIACDGRHIAFEPVPALASALARRFPGVDVRQIALSDERGQTSFVVHTALPSRSSIRPVGYPSDETETITVEVDRLDDALPRGYVPDLIKIDVEGAELLVLDGAIATLERARPVLLFEHQRETAQHYTTRTEQLWQRLDQLGYRIFDMDGCGPYALAQLVEVVATGRRWNFLARARA